MALRVQHVHGAKDPEKLRALAMALETFDEDLEHHLRMEEQELFPHILRGEDVGPKLEGAIHDHTNYLWFLDTVRELTREFTLPEGACGTWRALWDGLRRLSDSLTEHLALENELFFPRKT